MTVNPRYKTIDIRKEDFEFLDEIRNTPVGKVSYAITFHTIVNFWKENH
jgi:hypothetical protein